MRFLTILFSVIGFSGMAQTPNKVHLTNEDPYHYYIGDGEVTELFFYEMSPVNKPIGVLVIFPSGGQLVDDLLSEITLHQEAVKNDLLVIVPSYNWGTFRKVPDIEFLNGLFKQVVETHNVSKDKFVFCGLSNGGMISLSYAYQSNKSQNTFLKPKGVIALDPPLDYARFYRYCEREVARNYSPAGVGEAKFFLNSYNTIYHGGPDEFPQSYVEWSIYSHGAVKGGNTQYLTDIPVLMYSDLNTDFLINDRHRDLYDWNGLDIVAFVNQLKLNGNENATVVISQNKGVRTDGTINPHSWSILNTAQSMNWILEMLNK